MGKIIKVLRYLQNSRLFPALLKRRPKSLLAVVALLLSAWGVTGRDGATNTDGSVTDPGRVFAAFADLGMPRGAESRMQPSPRPPGTKPSSARWRTIREVRDGDTLVLDNGEVVRLVGVDAPEASDNRKLREDIRRSGEALSAEEMVRLGRAAAAFSREVAQGRRCWLSQERDRKDQYDRTLAYVHFENGAVLNELLLDQGYAKVYMNFDFRYKQRYVRLQAEAQAARRGLWSAK